MSALLEAVLTRAARLVAALFRAAGAAGEELMTELALRDPGPWLRGQAWREGYAHAGITGDPAGVHEARPLPPWVTCLEDFRRGQDDALRAAAAWQDAHPPRGRHHAAAEGRGAS